jgi:hypothetical protein
MRYSVRQRRWFGRGPERRPVPPDPYSRTSKDYAERNRETVTRLPGGAIRIDKGDPIGPSAPPAKALPAPEPTTAAPAQPVAPKRASVRAAEVDELAEARSRFKLTNALDT